MAWYWWLVIAALVIGPFETAVQMNRFFQRRQARKQQEQQAEDNRQSK